VVVNRILSHRWLLRLVLVLLVFGLITPQAWAWYHFRTAKSALAKHHPEAASRSLSSCLRVWGNRPSVRLMASRAARQAGELQAADQELRAAQSLTGDATDETAFEWALLQATGGNVREVEEYLQKRVAQSPEVGPLVWEAFAVGYLRIYRTLDAMNCLSLWLRREPENVRALELRGATYVTGKGVVRGVEDYLRVLELDPTRRDTRWKLTQCLLSLGSYDQAAKHLEWFIQEKPDDPGISAHLARCYNMLGRPQDARRLVEAALVNHPDDGPCLRTRGQLALTNPGNPDVAAAEIDLRRAVALMPEDYQAQQLLFQALQQQGKIDEAKQQLIVVEAIRDRAARIGELQSRQLAEQPLDPALHYEMAVLMIRSGQAEIGERWLRTALDLDPEHKPSHAALADLYESRGDKARAEEHRKKAAE
jgi:predicted Zn-dependent protease